MRRRLLALLLTFPAVVGGSLSAHALGYQMAVADGAERARLLTATGHGYLGEPALILIALLTILAVGGLLCVHAEMHGRGGARIAAWPFLLVAPAGFVIQECLERLVHDGRLPTGLIGQPEFLLGLALQFPFALVALLVARLVLRSARAAGARLRRAAWFVPEWAPAIAPARHPAPFLAVRPAVLAACAAERAPPAAAVR